MLEKDGGILNLYNGYHGLNETLVLSISSAFSVKLVSSDTTLPSQQLYVQINEQLLLNKPSDYHYL